MTKDITKLLAELKDDLKKEHKLFRETFERDFRTEFRTVQSELQGIKASMDFINKDYEDMKAKLKAAEEANSALEKKTVGLQEKYDVMLKTARETELRLIQCEQYSRNRNLEIKGIPRVENEDVMNLISTIGELVGENIAVSDIDICHRVPTRDPGKSNLIVQFQHRHTRDLILEKAKKKRITTTDLGFDTAAPVFVNEHLCPPLKRLLGMTQAKKRKCQWRYVWVRNCKILARKSDDAPVVTITHEDDLAKIC